MNLTELCKKYNLSKRHRKIVQENCIRLYIDLKWKDEREFWELAEEWLLENLEVFKNSNCSSDNTK